MENNIENIVSSIFHFSKFVSDAENEISNQSSEYHDLWWELETLNALALENWEKIGKPKNWQDWTIKYQSEASRLVKKLLAKRIPENNIVCDITHFLHFADWAESEIPNQSHSYAEYWWELESFKTQILEDWEKHGRPLEWEKWNRVYKSEALKLVRQVRNQHMGI
ncbi:hypothetical protein [Neisseria sp. CCUG12390]|uniref:hypothetical protein n=1 Tax=Neisseria sp. CCUG12390 TaxID=3392035 RepID=UPI003A102F97